MAAKTFYWKDAVPTGATLHRSLQDGGTPPTTATTTTGWVANSNVLGQSCVQTGGTEVSRTASGTNGWGTTLQPANAPSQTIGDCWRSENQLTGVFANANWTFTFGIRSVTAAYAGRLKLAIRVWRSSNANGTGAVELTSGRVASAATSASLTTSADTTVSWTWSPGATNTFNGEYLFIQVGIEITSAGSGTTQDVDFRVGSAYTLVTSNFSPLHPTSGALTGQGSAVAGSAARTRGHPTSGTISGAGSEIVGSAARSSSHVTHATSGVIAGSGAAVVGVASSATARTSSGALTGPSATIVGAAARTRAHVGNGVLAGPGATIAGSGTILRKHATSGALAAQGSAIAGAAARAAPGPVSHATSGALSGAVALIAGSASRAHLHASTGGLVASGATLSGTAARVHEHTSTGALLADGSIVAGAAGRLGHGVVAHDASGALAGAGTVISAVAYDLSPYRIFKIHAEDRVYVIPAEDAAWLLRGENRVYRV